MTFYHELVSNRENIESTIRPMPNTLKAKKVQVDLLGNIFPAND